MTAPIHIRGKRFLVVGLGTSGLAAARLLVEQGASVCVNDLRSEAELGARAADVKALGAELVTGEHPVELFTAVDHIVVSPGPCSPKEAGVSVPLINAFAGKYPILGVCLGHQSIGAAFGGDVVHAKVVMHGKTAAIHHLDKGMFRGLPNPFTAIRYHSLAVSRDTLPDCLEVTAWTDDGEIMGVRHKTLAVEGVQFHPESILTERGHDLLKNFLDEFKQ